MGAWFVGTSVYVTDYLPPTLTLFYSFKPKDSCIQSSLNFITSAVNQSKQQEHRKFVDLKQHISLYSSFKKGRNELWDIVMRRLQTEGPKQNFGKLIQNNLFRTILVAVSLQMQHLNH